MPTLRHVKPNEEQAIRMQYFRDKMQGLYEEIETLPNSRGKSLALTKLEESAMWLNKALTNNS